MDSLSGLGTRCTAQRRRSVRRLRPSSSTRSCTRRLPRCSHARARRSAQSHGPAVPPYPFRHRPHESTVRRCTGGRHTLSSAPVLQPSRAAVQPRTLGSTAAGTHIIAHAKLAQPSAPAVRDGTDCKRAVNRTQHCEGLRGLSTATVLDGARRRAQCRSTAAV